MQPRRTGNKVANVLGYDVRQSCMILGDCSGSFRTGCENTEKGSAKKEEGVETCMVWARMALRLSTRSIEFFDRLEEIRGYDDKRVLSSVLS